MSYVSVKAAGEKIAEMGQTIHQLFYLNVNQDFAWNWKEKMKWNASFNILIPVLWKMQIHMK